MTMSKADFQRIADGFAYVVGDPTADRNTVVKIISEFCNAAEARSPKFNKVTFLKACAFDTDRHEVKVWFRLPMVATVEEVEEELKKSPTWGPWGSEGRQGL